MSLGILLPNLVCPEIDKPLCIKDCILSLFCYRLCDNRIIEIESRESKCTIDTIDDHLCTKLEVIVDVCLDLTVGHNLINLTCLPSYKVILIQIILNLFWRCIGMLKVFQVIINLRELE